MTARGSHELRRGGWRLAGGEEGRAIEVHTCLKANSGNYSLLQTNEVRSIRHRVYNLNRSKGLNNIKSEYFPRLRF